MNRDMNREAVHEITDKLDEAALLVEQRLWEEAGKLREARRDHNTRILVLKLFGVWSSVNEAVELAFELEDELRSPEQ